MPLEYLQGLFPGRKWSPMNSGRLLRMEQKIYDAGVADGRMLARMRLIEERISQIRMLQDQR